MIIVREDDMNAQSGDRYYRLFDERTELELRVEQQCRISSGENRRVVWGAVSMAVPSRVNTLGEAVGLNSLLAVGLQKMAEWNGDIGHEHPYNAQVKRHLERV